MRRLKNDTIFNLFKDFTSRRECLRCFRRLNFELIFNNLIVAQTAINLLMHIYLHLVNVLRKERRITMLNKIQSDFDFRSF